MAPNVTTDTNTIAKRIASICYGSSSTGQGSYYNPEARTENCVFVSLAVLLGITAPELSRRTGILQPSNGSGGMREHEIARLMNKVRELGLVHKFVMSNVPFDYNGVSPASGWVSSPMQMVLYVAPSGPGGRPYGHCVVGGRGYATDYQHRGGPQAMFGREVTQEVYPNGFRGGNSICSTILVHLMSE